MRSADFKRDKDLFYVYFVLKFHPDRNGLLNVIKRFKEDEYFHAFKQENMVVFPIELGLC